MTHFALGVHLAEVLLPEVADRTIAAHPVNEDQGAVAPGGRHPIRQGWTSAADEAASKERSGT